MSGPVYVRWALTQTYLRREEVAKELRSALSHIKLSGEGVYVQASTLGSLEALLEFLKTSKIPVSTATKTHLYGFRLRSPCKCVYLTDREKQTLCDVCANS